MKIGEVTGGQKAVITVKGPKEWVELQTQTIRPFEGMLLLDVIKKENKIVSFKTQRTDLKSEIAVAVNGRPLVWKNVEIDRISLDKKMYYCVKARKGSEEKERRRAKRVPLTDSGFIQLEGSRAVPEVLVKDVSRTGFGVVIDRRSNVKVGDSLFLTFFDETRLGGSEIVLKNKYEFSCRVCRMEETESDRNILGLTIEKREQPLAGRLVRQKVAV